MKSAKLKRARKDKNDEFYTLREDVIEELDHYKEQLKGKRIWSSISE